MLKAMLHFIFISYNFLIMKQFCILLFFSLMNFTLQAQKGIAYYGQIKSPGMRSASGPDLNAYLVFNQEHSYYVTAKDSLEKDLYDNQSIFKGNNEQQVAYNGGKTTRYGQQVYYNRDKDSLWWSQRFRGNIYIAEERPIIEWKLQSETKEIGNFKAHKAIGNFRGRTYTAWYTLQIPLPYGPWKLQGLPGLILEAYDQKKEMYLYFKNVEYPTTNEAPISQVRRPGGDPDGWQTIQDFEKMERKSLVKAYNSMVLRAEKKGTEKPKKPVFQEIYIESFE
ncbi:GLPGLI family protein [Zunongwangia sp. F363]|uniref:GLPGLI family protein n=1 Tax=Autumnicola tepida TaxID=3075595 RepID=A0ABU3C5N2_9FLAO|nr:GLPGLI family protein [Zunongwangia sp. F363]MDT0641593.1 GLPGLI family protein [Zunongwangia sp. F363]